MNKDIFSAGKRMPYRVPDRFMDDLEERIVSKTIGSISSADPSNLRAVSKTETVVRSSRRRRKYGWFAFAGGVTAVAGLATFVILTNNGQLRSENMGNGLEAVQRAFARLDEEDQQFLNTLYIEDTFINVFNQ